MDWLKLVPFALFIIKQAQDFIEREKARSGKSRDEILLDAGVQFDVNQLDLAADLVRLSE